jgi:DNA-binding IclR family transcriptional regulator
MSAETRRRRTAAAATLSFAAAARQVPASATATARKPAQRRAAGVQSFEVGLSLLSLLAHQRRPMKITVLAAEAGMPAAKAHRYLASLVRSGYASQNPDTGLYSTGPAALDFSLSCLSTIEPIEIATAEAVELCRRSNHTVALSVWGSFGPTVVRWEQPPRPVMVNIGPGSVFPLLESATGRIFAAFYDEAVIRQHRQREAARAASHGESVAGATAGTVQESIEQVRRRGIARARGDFMSGLSAFAAPILDHRGRLVLAMTVLDYSRDWDHRIDGPVARELKESATRVSAALGWQ